jgi:acyl-CoA synthetase (NDP forming)
VVGANRRPLTIGHEILVNLVRGGFRGPVYPVNPHAERIAGHQAYPSLLDVPGPVDLAVIAVPPADVATVLAHCAKIGTEAAVVVTTGFAADGETGGTTEQDLARYARSVGIRLVGPACMGVIRPGARLAATFSPALPAPGRVAMSSQSGPLGLAVLDLAGRLGLGFSGFVSVGDAADVSANDLLRWWEDDVETRVVLLHVERFGDPRSFARIARRISARKPIVAVHPGAPRGDASGEGAARRLRSDAAVSSLFAQAGVIRTGTLQELFDMALLLAHQPLPRGPRVAVISNAGGPAELTTGACLANGLSVPPFSAPVRETLRGRLPAYASVTNPVDLSPGASAAHYRDAVSAAVSDDGIDAVVVMFMPPLAGDAERIAEAILDAASGAPGKPVVASYLGRSGVLPELTRDELVVPSFAFPESAAVVLGRAANHAAWRSLPAGITPRLPGVDPERARALLADRAAGWLPAAAAAGLLDAYGVRVSSAPGPAGPSAFVGVINDPVFGPVITFGLTGDYADLMDDIAYRITPLTDRDADELVHAIRGAALLEGWRGRPSTDVAALKDLLLRVSAMVEDLPAVAELELRPIRVLAPGAGVTVSRVRIRLATPPPGAPP